MTGSNTEQMLGPRWNMCQRICYHRNSLNWVLTCESSASLEKWALSEHQVNIKLGRSWYDDINHVLLASHCTDATCAHVPSLTWKRSYRKNLLCCFRKCHAACDGLRHRRMRRGSPGVFKIDTSWGKTILKWGKAPFEGSERKHFLSSRKGIEKTDVDETNPRGR